MGKFLGGCLIFGVGAFVGFKIKEYLVAILHYEASTGDEDSKEILDKYRAQGKVIHDFFE